MRTVLPLFTIEQTVETYRYLFEPNPTFGMDLDADTIARIAEHDGIIGLNHAYKVVVTLLPDTGERYLSTGLFDEPQRGQRDE